MATETLPPAADAVSPNDDVDTAEAAPLLAIPEVRRVLKPLASLKLTITLFALAIIIVLVGSLAQATKDVWIVVSEYFRTGLAWIDLKDCFPPSFFPWAIGYDWAGLPIRYIPFPGGWAIGAVMAVNLVAAHALRFKAQTKGSRLYTGLVVIGVGLVMTWAVIASGMNSTGLQTASVLSYATVWKLLLVGLGFGAAAAVYGAIRLPSEQKTERWIAGIVGVAFAGLLGAWLMQESAGQLSDASMRILWQLMKATIAGLVTLVGCFIVFRKRAGIVLLHGGIGLMMFSELLVGTTVSENHLTVAENKTTNFVYDIRERELAVIDRSDPDTDQVVIIPEAMFAISDDATKRIDDERLPVILEIVQYLPNSTVRRGGPMEAGGPTNPATKGTGCKVVAVDSRESTGMESSVDMGAMYVNLIDRTSNESLGTWLLTMHLSEEDPRITNAVYQLGGTYPKAESFEVSEKPYSIALRFKRTYKPYEVTLHDVRKEDYVGTTTPRDYSSDIRLVDRNNNVDQEAHIWMNNPLRYAGETFYQTSYRFNPFDEVESTTLQIVDNTGWMLPYVACMIVVTGMLAQFLIVLMRFLKRRQTVTVANDVAGDSETSQQRWKAFVVPVCIAMLAGGWMTGKARPPAAGNDEFDLYAFGKIPLAYEGREQPIDSLARNHLRMISGRSEVRRWMNKKELAQDWSSIHKTLTKRLPESAQVPDEAFDGDVLALIDHLEKKSGVDRDRIEDILRSVAVAKGPAIEWLLDVLVRPEVADQHFVYRVDNPQLVSVLNLDPREKWMYSESEVRHKEKEFRKQLDAAVAVSQEDDNKLSVIQRKVLSLGRQQRIVNFLRESFMEFEFENSRPHSSVGLAAIFARKIRDERQKPPLAVPGTSDDPSKIWLPFIVAHAQKEIASLAASRDAKSLDDLARSLADVPADLRTALFPSIEGWTQMLEEQIKKEDAGIPVQSAAAIFMSRVESPFQQQILGLIARSEKGATAEQIFESTPEDRLKDVALTRIFIDVAESMTTSEKRAMQAQLASATEPGSPDQIKQIVQRTLKGWLIEIFADMSLDDARSNIATTQLPLILAAYGDGNAKQFNELVAGYRESIASAPPGTLDVSRIDFEAWFNHFSPFYYSIYLYLFAFLLAGLAWLGWSVPLNRTSFWLIIVTLVVHTIALIARIYISGRPPVTNLYSSAVFIGWGCVILSLAFELIYRMGVGNVIASVAGAATLTISHQLAGDGDTFTVLQAVLDTQFWLATHVVCITLGYSATFLAGLLGVLYVLVGVVTPRLTATNRKELTRMIYGTLCFAIFFSFFGTVLGGLWADDSWGRFWGWDPKENGALMIVLWNALVLHARWDGMARDRGLAVLAVGGNIITGWSWFGVNELGAGLHAYGFTEGRLFYLGLFILSQLIVIAIGSLPRDTWLSFRRHPAGT